MPGSRGVRSVLIGIVAGSFSGLTGVGGGSIMVPLMTGQLGLSQHRAHGSSLAIIAFVAVAGALGYAHAGNIDWRLVLALTPGAIAGVLVGARTMMRLPEARLKLLFGLFLLFVAFRQLVWQVEAGAPGGGIESLLVEAAFGFAGGLLAGVLGVGGGAIFVPAIVIFGLADLSGGADPQKVAQGVSLVVIVLTGFAGTITNVRQGAVDAPTVRWIAPAAVVAAFAASIVANDIDAAVLERIYGVTALLLGVQTIFESARRLRAAEQG